MKLQSKKLLELFFSEIQAQKMFIIDEMIHKSLYISDLEGSLREGKKKIKRIIESLKVDISEYNEKYNRALLLVATKETVYFYPTINDGEKVEIKSYLQEKYLLESSLFKSLLFILENRYFSIINLARNLSYSESYAYKLINKLKDLILLRDLGISIAKKSETLLWIKGDEVVIRLLHYILTNNCTIKGSWHFRTIVEAKISFMHSYLNAERIKKLSPSNIKKVNNLIAVYENALRNGCFSLSLPTAVRSLGRIINKEKELSMYLYYLSKKELESVKELHSELIQLAFLLNYFVPELRSKKEKIALGKELADNKRNQVVKPCVMLVDKIREKHRLTQENYYLLIYSLCNRLIIIHYLKFYKFMRLDSFHSRNFKIDTDIELAINRIFKAYKTEPSYEKIVFNFTQIIVSNILLDINKPLKVYVEFQHRPEYKAIIENALILTYSESILTLVEDHHEADVIIADNYFIELNQKFFYFQDVFDQLSWSKLGSYLNKVIQENIVKDISIS